MTNFIIIEAWDVGGRTRTLKFGSKGTGVNLGASWISGACYNVTDDSCYSGGYKPTAINPMLKLALKYNTSFVNMPFGIPPMLNGSNGGKLIDPLTVSVEYGKWEVVQRCLWEIALSILVGETEDMSYWNGLNLCGWKPPLTSIQKTIQWSQFMQNGGDIKLLSLFDMEWPAIGTYELYGNQDLYINDAGGYQGIVINYAKEYLDLDNIHSEAKIILNSAIELIEYNNQSGVTVHIKNSDKIYHAKYAIVTFSVGVLQSNIVQFEPDLPIWKKESILRTDFGQYTPIYIEWPYAFWNKTFPEIDDQIILLSDSRYGYFSRIINLNNKDLLPGSLIWRMDVVEEIAVNVAFQDIKKTIDQLIYGKLVDYFDINIIPEPVNVFVGGWSHDIYVEGCYAAFPMHYDLDKEQKKLQWNVENVLYFGGEATANDTGYVSSAYFEGIKAAQMILNCLGYENTDGYKCQGPFVEEQNSNISVTKLHQPKQRRSRQRKHF
eukprot:150323_1